MDQNKSKKIQTGLRSWHGRPFYNIHFDFMLTTSSFWEFRKVFSSLFFYKTIINVYSTSSLISNYCVDTNVYMYICFNQQRVFQICDSEDTFVSCSFVIHIKILSIFDTLIFLDTFVSSSTQTNVWFFFNQQIVFFQICDSEDTFVSCSFVIHIKILSIFDTLNKTSLIMHFCLVLIFFTRLAGPWSYYTPSYRVQAICCAWIMRDSHYLATFP